MTTSSAYAMICARNASPHPVNRQCFRNRFMYRLASRGLTTPPCGVPQLLRMRDRVEVLRQIGVHDIGVAPAEKPVHFLDRVARSASGTIAIGTVLEVRLEDRFEHELGGSLNHPIPNRRNAERAFSAPRLWDHHPPHRHRPIPPRDEVLTQTRQPLCQP